MVRLVDETLRDERRFGVAEGLASPNVILADPAMGTGTFLLGVLRRIADRIEEDQGEGAVPAVIRAALAPDRVRDAIWAIRCCAASAHGRGA
jgi:hypothetical protein